MDVFCGVYQSSFHTKLIYTIDSKKPNYQSSFWLSDDAKWEVDEVCVWLTGIAEIKNFAKEGLGIESVYNLTILYKLAIKHGKKHWKSFCATATLD